MALQGRCERRRVVIDGSRGRYPGGTRSCACKVGATKASKAVPGTIRGDFSLSAQENIVNTSDSLENAEIELKRFFVESDYCDYKSPLDPFKYAPDEY